MGIKFVTPDHSDTTVMLWRYAVTGLSFTSRRASETRAGGHDQHVAGINRRWFGSINHQRKRNPNQLRLSWLLEQQQGRHLSWQSPGAARATAISQCC